MLIITNGSSAVAAMERAGIVGEKLPWEDVLHDGPIPAGLDLEALSTVRARFIADRGWGAFDEMRSDFRRRDGRLRASHDDDEVVLWFEHDLYDQLQLLQLLDWFGAPVRRPQRLSAHLSRALREPPLGRRAPPGLRGTEDGDGRADSRSRSMRGPPCALRRRKP